MTMDNGIDAPEETGKHSAGALARIFSGIASHIHENKTEEAYEMAKQCAREFSRIAADEGGIWKPLTDEQYLAGLEASRERQRRAQAALYKRNGLPVAHLKGQMP